MTGDSRASTTSAYEPLSINKVFHVQQDGVVQILNLCKRTLFFLKMELIFETLKCSMGAQLFFLGLAGIA